MELDKFNLMTQLNPFDRLMLELTYDGPIPIEAIKGKLQKQKEYDETMERLKRGDTNETNS